MTTPVWNNEDTSPFKGSRFKLARAKCHLAEIRAFVEGYISRKNYSVRFHEEVKGKTIIAWLSVKEPMPVFDWAVIIGDVVHNLRSCLDLIACSLVRLEDEPSICEWTSFPIFETAEEFGKKVEGKIRGAHAEAIDIIKGLEPHGEGNVLFYQLSMLDNIDKHRLLIPVFGLLKGEFEGQSKVISVTEGSRLELDDSRDISFKDGTPLLRIRAIDCTIYPKENAEGDIAPEIMFGEPKVSAGIPVLKLLGDATSLVERTLEMITNWAFWEYGHLSPRVLKAKADEAKGSST